MTGFRILPKPAGSGLLVLRKINRLSKRRSLSKRTSHVKNRIPHDTQRNNNGVEAVDAVVTYKRCGMAGQIRRKTQSQIEENVEGAGGLRVTLACHHADGGDLSDRLEISEAEPGQSSGQQNGPAFMDSPQKRQTGRQQNKGRVEDDRCQPGGME